VLGVYVLFVVVVFCFLRGEHLWSSGPTTDKRRAHIG
jgi:hypothetical protein